MKRSASSTLPIALDTMLDVATANTIEPRPFVQRVIRILAIAGIIHGGVDVSGGLVLLLGRQFPFGFLPNFRAGGWQVFYTMGMFSMSLGLAGVLVLGSIGALRSRIWAAKCLLIWAGAAIFLALANSVPIAMQIYSGWATPGVVLTLYSIVATAGITLHGSILPAVVIYLLRQDEVRATFTPGAVGGFDVIPMAHSDSVDHRV